MNKLKVYLAGKVGGKKWNFARLIEDKKIDWRSSDGNKHGEHDFGGAQYTYGALRCEVQDWAISRLEESDLLVAYLDRPTSFGSIAEIAYQSAKGKPSIVFVKEHPDNHLLWDDWVKSHNGKMYDAYWFVSCFPHVHPYTVDSAETAADFFQRVIINRYLCESPMEVAFFEAAVHRIREVIPQYIFGDFRLDFAIPTAKLAIEIDGHDYHSSKGQRQADASRDRTLIKAGWTPIRFTGSEIFRDVEHCVENVVDILKSRKPELLCLN